MSCHSLWTHSRSFPSSFLLLWSKISTLCARRRKEKGNVSGECMSKEKVGHHVLSSFYLGPPLWANGRINLQIEPQRLSAISWLMWASMKERRKDDEAHDDSTLLGPLKKKKRRRAQQQDQETELPDQMHNHQIISVHLIEVLVIWSWCCHPFLCRSQERFRLSETQERKKSPDQIKEKLK